MIDFFDRNEIEFNTTYLYSDVDIAIKGLHKDRIIHKKIHANPTEYINPSSSLVSLFKKLRAEGKKIFMLTNNCFKYVDLGCTKMFEEMVNDSSNDYKHWSEV